MLSLRPLLIVFLSVILCPVSGRKIFSRQFEIVETKFIDYIVQFNKSYRFDEGEYRKRFVIFQTSLEIINTMNTFRTHKDSARFGLTQYTDMSHEEFQAAQLNSDLMKATANRRSNFITKEVFDHRNIIRYIRDTIADSDHSLPTKIDWRERGIVTKVRNQGPCGACWAHSVIETVESMSAIEANSSAIELSVQQMVDCSTNNHGCMGGDTCTLLEWLVHQNVSIHTMNEYPTNNADTQCKMGEMKNMSQTVHVNRFTCESYVGEEQKIVHLLANYGPVVAAVNGLLWQNYLGGIIQFHCDGATTSLNHAVQIVGYDMTADVPHYIVRNSWGEKFGNKGYLKIQIGGNVCGLANQVSTVGVNVDSKN